MDIQLVISLLPKYLAAAGITLELTVFTLIFGLIGGFFVAAMKMSKSKILHGFASVYISVVRGTPLLLQIIFVYYSLPAFGVTLQPMQAAILALSINEIAYMAETIRGGIEAVDVGQWEAAKSLGFGGVSTMLVIVLPQAVKVIIPQFGNMAVSMIKDTSLVSTISLAELMRVAQTSYSTTFQPLETYLLAGILYYVLSSAVSMVFKMTEKKMKTC